MMCLFIEECKQISKSIIYLAFVGAVILFYVTQLGNFAGNDIKSVESNTVYTSSNPLIKPPANAESYGTRQAEIPEQIMPRAMLQLVEEYQKNSYTTYPFGFGKQVKLSEKQQLRISEIATEITGLKQTELEKLTTDYYSQMYEAYQNDTPMPQTYEVIPIIVSYDMFKEKMAEADKILGGGSQYTADWLANYYNSGVPMTYEEKMAEYNAFISEDKITGAYARLFCDYMGIVISLFSIFVPVSFLMRDKKAHINELIYSRKKGSTKLVFSRYFAVVLMSLLPILLLSIIPTVQLISYGIGANILVDAFGFIKYIVAWLLPTLLTTTAVGFFLTILTDTPAAIVFQLIWSLEFDIMRSIGRMGGGNYGFELTIRHNTLGNLQAVKGSFDALVLNRIAYSVLALLLIAITSYIYEQKRRGGLDVGGNLQKIFRRNKGAN